MTPSDWINLGIQIVIAAITLLGFLWGIVKYVQSRFDKMRDQWQAELARECHDRNVQVAGAIGEARTAADKLDAFILKAIETFATKQGVSDAFDRLTKTVEGVGTNVDRKFEAMTERLDRVIENRPQPPPRT